MTAGRPGAGAGTSHRDCDATEFALRCADTLASTLNLRRTVASAVGLAVPRFGSWAALTFLDGAHLRRADTAGVDHFAPGTQPQRVRDLSRDAVNAWTDALTERKVHAAPVPVATLEAFGVPAGTAELLAGGDAVLVTAPLPASVAGTVVFAVASPHRPDLAEFAEFLNRVSRAVTAAAGFEERTTLAHTLRKALLPAALPSVDGVEFGAAYRPAQEATQIGGDFYDVVPAADGRWALSIGDVCGKGVDAAVLTGQVRQTLRTASLVTADPATTLRLVNDAMVRADGSTFVTAAYALLDPTPGGVGVELASGGHPPPLLLHDGRVQAVTTTGTLIGMLPDVRLETTSVRLAAGDVLLFYTDGAPEARGPAGMLGTEPIAAALVDCAGMTAQAITERVMQLVVEHLGGWGHDDIALLALRCAP